MKTKKAEAHEKGGKKAAKKELQKKLTDKFFEAVKSLGHDAATIGEDLVLVSKFVAKKISKKVSSKKEVSKKASEVVDHVSSGKKKDDIKKVAKASKKSRKVADKILVEDKGMNDKPQVTGLASEEKLSQFIQKPTSSGNGKPVKAKPAVLKPTAAKLSSKKDGTAAE